MKEYLGRISLNRNGRGCYILDTVKGCGTCLKTNKEGCYGECYAKKIADRYNFNFSKSIKRGFETDSKQLFLQGFKDNTHLNSVIRQINMAKMPFIRIGEMGDPSEDWEHTISICKDISVAKKSIVIVTKHWNIIPEKLLPTIEKLNICINTSISALDNDEQISTRMNQFCRLKRLCKSVLRVVSCDFNLKSKQGRDYNETQKELLSYAPVIDTIFRCGINNPLVKNKIINISKVKFLNSWVYASVNNKSTYFGACEECPDMCGI